MTRIVAGASKGRRLAVPAGARPTSDRAREGLFASAEASLGTLAGAHVLDLYAGSGAVGLEALSRGAADVILVEADRAAAQVIRGNIETLGLPGAHLLPGLVERVLAHGPGGAPPRDFVFADPPYAASAAEVARAVELLAGRRCARGGGARHQVRAAILAARISAGQVQEIRGRNALVRSRRRYGVCPVADRRVNPHASCRLSRVVRSCDQRAPRHHQPSGEALRRGGRRRGA